MSTHQLANLEQPVNSQVNYQAKRQAATTTLRASGWGSERTERPERAERTSQSSILGGVLGNMSVLGGGGGSLSGVGSTREEDDGGFVRRGWADTRSTSRAASSSVPSLGGGDNPLAAGARRESHSRYERQPYISVFLPPTLRSSPPPSPFLFLPPP